MVTAAVPGIPEPLISQVKVGGLIVAPVGKEASQNLIVCEKKPVGTIERAICGVRFVRLIGRYSFAE